MSTNYIDEYLVKLGSSVDQSGMQNFYQALKEAATVSDASATAIAGSFFKAQTDIVGGFLAIGSAAIGLVDKVAMADQSYRLLALNMHISKDAARALKIDMDALGATMGQLTWDPELRRRSDQLMKDMRAMAPNGDYDAQMEKIRDIRFQFTRMEVESQFLAMHVVNDFLTALGGGPDTLLDKLTRLNTWITTHLPEISAKVVGTFLPVWKDVQGVFHATEGAVKETAIAFTNLIGIFDHSLGGNTASLQKFGSAIADLIHLFAVFVESIASVEEMLAHLLSAIGLAGQGKWSEAGGELKAAFHSITAKAVGGVIGGAAGGVFGGAATGAAIGSVLGPAGTAVGGVIGGGIGALSGSFIGSNIGDLVHGTGSAASVANTDLHAIIDHYASQFGVDPLLAHAVAHAESGERQHDKNGNLIRGKGTSAIGAFQLLSSTAKMLGVDASDTSQNAKGGVSYLAHLLKQYNGNVPEAVAAYHEGAGKLNSVLAGRATLSPGARSEVASVMKQLGTTGDVHVGDIVINVQHPNASPEHIAHVVVAQIKDLKNKQVQRNLAQTQGWATPG